MYLKNTCHIEEQTFSDTIIDSIIKLGEQKQISNAEVFDGNKSEKTRKTKVSWINEKELSTSPLTDIITKANKKAGWNFQLHGFEPFQYSIYEKDDHYDWHIDSHVKPYDDGLIRKLSFTLCLSDDYKGGNFELCKPNPKPEKHLYKKFDLKKGSMIIFPSFVWHKVNPVLEGVRKTLVGWVVGKPFV
tara:strand:- start:61 stop:624 length:564 start_codon:yes stop_codon:yes gene_type:complete